MSPRISYDGHGVEFSHPSQLLSVLPRAPLQPLAEWPQERELFRQRLAAAAAIAAAERSAQRRGLEAAIGVLISNHLIASPSDAPGGAPSAKVRVLFASHYGSVQQGHIAHPAGWGAV